MFELGTAAEKLVKHLHPIAGHEQSKPGVTPAADALWTSRGLKTCFDFTDKYTVPATPASLCTSRELSDKPKLSPSIIQYDSQQS